MIKTTDTIYSMLCSMTLVRIPGEKDSCSDGELQTGNRAENKGDEGGLRGRGNGADTL